MGNSQKNEVESSSCNETTETSECGETSIPLNGYFEKMTNSYGQYMDVSDSIEGAEELKNYGVFPLRILHLIFLHLELKDLFHVLPVCRLFHKVCSTNLFWKDYFRVHYTLEDDERSKRNENWKEIFFKEVLQCGFYEHHNRYYERELDFFQSSDYRSNRKGRRRSFRRDYRMKILLIGNLGVGKSCLLLRYAEDSFNEKQASTIGVDFKVRTVRVGDSSVTLQVWDTAGQERFRTITNSYYQGGHGFLLCFSLNDRKSFQDLEMWLKDMVSYCDDREYTKNVVFVGLKTDLDREITRKEIKMKMVEYVKFLGLEDEHLDGRGRLKNLMELYAECSPKKGSCCSLPFGLVLKKFYLRKLRSMEDEDIIPHDEYEMTAK